MHLALDVLRDLERAGAGGMLRVRLVPPLPDRGRAGDADRGQVVDQEGPRLLRRDGDGEVIDLLVAGDRREKGGTRAALRVRVELGLFVQHAVEREDHGVRVERRTIVELHALPQRERPGQVVGGARPGGRESGDGVRRGGALPGVPVEQAVVDVHAHEADALAALSHELVRDWDVAGRHGDAQRAAASRRVLLSGHDRRSRHGAAPRPGSVGSPPPPQALTNAAMTTANTKRRLKR